jgi:SAM-dependent methyltransferase
MPATSVLSHDAWLRHYATPRGCRWWPCDELVRFGGRHGSLGRVLEVGCGNGANLLYLTTVGVPVGLDCTWKALSLVAARAPLVQADARALPFVTGAFDTLVDVMTSQHLPWKAHAALFADYRRVLRPGGRLFLYHLTNDTSGGCRTMFDLFDHRDGIALFPEAGFVCLPNVSSLVLFLKTAGFMAIEERALIRVYPDGSRAAYAVLEGVTA